MSGGDEDLLDGFDEIDQESQDKIRRALKQGHVDDEDWKGVSRHIAFQKLLVTNSHSHRTLRRIVLVRRAFA